MNKPSIDDMSMMLDQFQANGILVVLIDNDGSFTTRSATRAATDHASRVLQEAHEIVALSIIGPDGVEESRESVESVQRVNPKPPRA